MPVYFLLGSLANTAGIENDYVGAFYAIAAGISQFFQNTCNLFRIVDVHLAPVGVNKVVQCFSFESVVGANLMRQSDKLSHIITFYYYLQYFSREINIKSPNHKQ